MKLLRPSGAEFCCIVPLSLRGPAVHPERPRIQSPPYGGAWRAGPGSQSLVASTLMLVTPYVVVAPSARSETNR